MYGNITADRNKSKDLRQKPSEHFGDQKDLLLELSEKAEWYLKKSEKWAGRCPITLGLNTGVLNHV